MRLILLLLLAWIVLAVIGLVVDVLKWLLWLAIILIAATLVIGALRRFGSRRSGSGSSSR